MNLLLIPIFLGADLTKTRLGCRVWHIWVEYGLRLVATQEFSGICPSKEAYYTPVTRAGLALLSKGNLAVMYPYGNGVARIYTGPKRSTVLMSFVMWLAQTVVKTKTLRVLRSPLSCL